MFVRISVLLGSYLQKDQLVSLFLNAKELDTIQSLFQMLILSKLSFFNDERQTTLDRDAPDD